MAEWSGKHMPGYAVIWSFKPGCHIRGICQDYTWKITKINFSGWEFQMLESNRHGYRDGRVSHGQGHRYCMRLQVDHDCGAKLNREPGCASIYWYINIMRRYKRVSLDSWPPRYVGVGQYVGRNTELYRSMHKHGFGRGIGWYKSVWRSMCRELMNSWWVWQEK